MQRTLGAALSVAVLALAATSGVAQATRFSFARAESIRIATVGRLRLTERFGILEGQCTVSVSGALRRGPIEAVAGELFGEITGFSLEGCRPLLESLPWDLRYAGVAGTLPEGVTALLFEIGHVTMTVPVMGSPCLYRGTLPVSWALRGGNPYETGGLTLREEATLTSSTGGLCPASMHVAGTLSLTPTQTITFS